MNTRPLNDFWQVYAYPREKQMLELYFKALLRLGVLIGPTSLMALSTAMSEIEIDRLCELSVKALREMREQFDVAA